MTQPDPTPDDSRPVWELVIEDMRARDQTGRERYGVPLQAGNGRDALRDAYEEALDLAVYLRQAIAERDFRRAEPPVPRPLFEAAVRVLRGQFVESYNLWLLAQFRAGTESHAGTAERIIRRAAACGVREDG